MFLLHPVNVDLNDLKIPIPAGRNQRRILDKTHQHKCVCVCMCVCVYCVYVCVALIIKCVF